MTPDRDDRLGVADAHGIIAALCGLVVFGSSCACAVHPIRADEWQITLTAVAAATLWSGLFGVLVPGSRVARALSSLGLLALIVSTGVIFFMVALDRAPF